jgi:hypothetical protein
MTTSTLDDEVAYWRFDGNLLDQTANNNNLTAVNAPTYVAPLFGSNIYLSGDCAITWKGFIADQEEGSYGICGADEEVAYGQIKVENNSIVIKTETDQTGADVIDISGVNVEDVDTGLITFILERASDVWSLYLNGTVVGNTATVAGVLNIQQFLGSPEDTADLGYLGGMKDFKVYSATLSAGDKTTINAGGHVSTNCVYWANTNATTTSVSDLSGSGRTGTLSNNGTNFFHSYVGSANLFVNGGLNGFPAYKTITGITKANPGVVSCVGHGFSNGNVVLFNGLTEMTELNGNARAITVINADSFSIGDTSTFGAAETTGGDCVYFGLPNNWSNTNTESADAYVIEVNGKARVYTTGGNMGFGQNNLMTIGQNYSALVYIKTIASNNLYFYNTGINSISSLTFEAGKWNKWDFTAVDEDISIIRRVSGALNDVTVSYAMLTKR